jgi:hypothetical protein
MGTYLLWAALGVGALVLLIVMFTLFSKDSGRGPDAGGGKDRSDDRDAGPPGPGTPR